LLVTANVVPISPILVNLMKEALSSSETSVFTRATRRNIPEDIILLQSYLKRHENRWTYRYNRSVFAPSIKDVYSSDRCAILRARFVGSLAS
jgi:hypothetical protein